jgi:hypothetical protein
MQQRQALTSGWREKNRKDFQSLTAEISEAPDGGYGWVCVGLVFTINVFSWGVVAVS